MSQPGQVIVVGSVNVDLTMRTDSIVAPGATVPGRDFATLQGGKGANQAVAAARAGASTSLVACIGADAYGESARAALRDADVADDRVRVIGDSPTGMAFIQVADDGENAIVVVAGANAELSPADVDAAFGEVTGEPPVVVLGLETPFATMTHAAREASARGWTVILNPAPARALPSDLLPLIDVLVPNEHEAEALGHSTIDDLLAAGTHAVVVTRGARGARIHTTGEVTDVPAVAVSAIDTTGAGDAFIGALAASVAAGASLVDAVGAAAHAGADATTRIGAR